MLNYKEFKNGNVNLQYDIKYSDCKASELDTNKLTFEIIDTLTDHDFIVLSEDWESYGNFNAMLRFYCLHNSKVYTVIDTVLMDLRAGKSVKLYACDPTIDDKQELNAALEE